ncbi:hypothetical protein W603_02481 [Staphylococcus aureus VET0353R]|nr:hypothetical protein W603_02481 [Staphylococcus aureus VET0353R]EZU93991.1 hypothetical protein V148_02284 [Staphylococcus aureus 11P8]
MTQHITEQHRVINEYFLNHELTKLKLSSSTNCISLKSEVV